MCIGEYTIRSWDELKKTFFKKYQDYCRSKESNDDIFKMQQQEDESLEEYLEMFLYSYQIKKEEEEEED